MDEQQMSSTELVELNGKFERLMDAIDGVKERQEDMADDIAKIKEAVYNPDEGLYARLRALESWKKTSSRVIWMVVTALSGLVVATVWSVLLDI
jgi:peptidoglycan hydrolase CwlO-like protein